MKKLKIFFILLIFTNAIATNNVNIIIFENKVLNKPIKESQSSALLYEMLHPEIIVKQPKESNLFEKFHFIKDHFITDAIKRLEQTYQIIYKNRIVFKNQKTIKLNIYSENSSVIGKILIKKSKFYDFYFDMDVIKNNYKLKMHQKIRSNKDKLNYVDHPFIGILVYVE